MRKYFIEAFAIMSIIFVLTSSNVQSAQVGMNTGVVMPWSSQIIFVDVFKRSFPWVTFEMVDNGQWDTNANIPLDANGYPLEVPFIPEGGNGIPQGVASYIFTGMEGHYPSGTYTLMFEGAGGLILGNGDNETFYSEGGSYPVDINSDFGDLMLIIIHSDVENPIQNIRLIMPGFENVYQTQPFYPPFIDRLDDTSVIRFAQTMRTNDGDYPCDNGVAAGDGTCVKVWENRNGINNQTQASPRGVALEYLIDMANQANIDPWFNIPHGADDNYIHEFATMVYQRLNSDRRVYIELSNELFNFTSPYPQNRWAIAAGVAMDEAMGLQNDSETSRLRFITKRSADIFHIFAQVFGSEASQRVVNVLPGWIVQDVNNNTLLEGFNDITLNPNQVRPNALAIAPYFGWPVADGVNLNGENITITPGELVQRARDEINQTLPDPLAPGEFTESIASMIQRNSLVSQNHGVRMIAYEGGQHIVQNNGWENDPVLGQKAIDANRHPDMYWAYRELFNTWNDLGGELFVHYSLIGKATISWGSFGSLEWTDQVPSSSYKYQAIMDYQVEQ